MRKECIKRKLDISKANIANDYIKLLFIGDNPPPDWGVIYCRVLYHTGMDYEEIERRTILQINAILEGAGENLSIKLGVPYFPTPSASEESAQEVDNETRLSQIKQIEQMFNR